MEVLYNEAWKYPIHMTLNVTDACNMRCRYCFAEKHPHIMSLETAKKAVDWLANNYKIQKENNWFGAKEINPNIE
jgi:sulfatase maturation enzyme AslB (radical SAM superfamily)